MSLESDIYDRLEAVLGSSVDHIFDTKRPDGFELGAKKVVTFQRISSIPHAKTLAGQIPFFQTLMQVAVSVDEHSLTAGRALRKLIIDGLHNYRSDSIVAAWYESDLEITPSLDVPEYQIPIDFMFLNKGDS